MGEVYKARDTRLDRDAAIKILPEAFASDGDRVARFQREAKTLAALNHPNIAQIFGLEQTGDVRALAMELVAGEDLSRRIARGPLPIGEALPIAKQIAEALEAAHEQGIIHRDLKPANIKVREDGTVKVLDFGLAKAIKGVGAAVSEDLTQAPTMTTPAMTQAGMILGTAAYMSPEQARGQAVDKRTDIWAFGCVLCEMLTGRAVFERQTVSDMLAAIIAQEPDWSALPSSTPATVRRLLQRCLDKDPRHRLRDIGDARAELHDTVRVPTESTPVVSPGRRATTGWVWAASAVAIVATGLLGFWLLPRSAEAPWQNEGARGLWKFQEDKATELWKPTDGGLLVPPAVSADGTQLAFTAHVNGHGRLYSMNADGTNVRSRADTLDVRDPPAWSPDGKWLAAAGNDGLVKVPIEGGAPVTIVKGLIRLPIWSPDGRFILYSEALQGPGYTVKAVSPDGTTVPIPALWVRRGGDRYRLLPDSKHVVYIGGDYGNQDFWLLNLENSERRQLTDLQPGFSIKGFDVSPDGKRILFDRVRENSDVVLIDLPRR